MELRLPAGISPEAVLEQLRKILSSGPFVHSERLSRFLRFTVEHAVKGQAEELKEYLIGVEVFDRRDTFDPRLDPIVRVEAGRLRTKLSRYYETEGRSDPVLIDFPRGGYAPVFRPGSAPSMAQPPTPGAFERKTIAVLPFADQSPNKDQEYFCDGMTEELINALTKVEGLRVAAWTSMLQLKGKPYDIREIGLQLNVGAVLEGSVRKEGERLRITAHLVDVAEGCYLWSESYDRELKDVFAIQEQISRAIVDTLKIQLVGGPNRQLVRRSTESSTAYKLYLKGRYYWNKRSKEGLWKGVEYFEKALEKDPGYALAHAGLADSYSLLGNYGVLPSHTVREKAKEAAARAVEIDATLAEAHTSLGHVRATYEWDWGVAEREFELAIQLNPRYATAHHWYAITCLMPQRRLDEALLEIEEAQELDPVSASIARDAGVVCYSRREYDRSLDQARRTQELDPNFYEAYWLLGLGYEQKLQFEEANAAFRKGVSLYRSPRMIGALGHSYALWGRNAEAHEALRELSEMAERRYVSPFDTALIFMGLREKDRAFEWLDEALAMRCYELVWLKVDPRWDILRSDTRFISILNAIGLERAGSTSDDFEPARID
jgi:TolB-like protein/Tfp pilus assembly protein PilF